MKESLAAPGLKAWGMISLSVVGGMDEEDREGRRGGG